MDKRLAGKVAIISGAARGLGAADVRLFVKEGARVVQEWCWATFSMWKAGNSQTSSTE